MIPNKASFLYSRIVSGYSVQCGQQIDKWMLECLLLNSKPEKTQKFFECKILANLT